MIDPLALVASDDPYPDFHRLRSDGPVHWLADRGLWAVVAYDEARRVLIDAETFTSEAMATMVTRPGRYDAEPTPAADVSVSIIGTDGATHERLRRILNRGFTPARVEPLRTRIAEIAHDLLVTSDEIDLQATFADVLPAMVIAELLGVDREIQAEFHRWSAAMLLAVFGSPTAEEAAEIGACLEAMGEWLDAVIASRHDVDGGDLISVLLRAESVDDVLTHDELRTFVFTLLVAGSITTAFLIGNGLIVLADQPEQWPTLAENAADFVEEVLRFDAPAQVMLRTCRTATDLGDHQIEEGDTVAVALGAANRDGQVFVAPDRFQPDRRPAAHLAFGYGPHFCLGAALARLEAVVAFEVIGSRAAGIELTEPVIRLDSEFLRGPSRLVGHLRP